jgi:Na+:H+ antiporter, NhaA family
MGVMLGLVYGKFIGISGFSWLAVRLRFARLPGGFLGSGMAGGYRFHEVIRFSTLANQAASERLLRN